MLHSKYLPGRFARQSYGAPLEFAPSLGAVPTTTTQTVTVTDSADPVITGADAFNYTVQYTNTGSINATSVSVAITVDSSLAITGQSGTGWSFSVAGQVVTATQGSIAPGAANPITINVTTGTSALTATTSAQATANNATTANGSQNTTVQLVSKDATAGKYVPASSTEWSNFIARKGLSIAVPDALWLLQESTGNPADSIGGFTLTKSGTVTYQAAETGWTRVGIKTTDGTSGKLSTTNASLPDISASSMTTLAYANVSAASAQRAFIDQGVTTVDRAQVNTTPRLVGTSGANNATGAASPEGQVRPYVVRTNRTAGSATIFSDVDKLTPTWATGVTGKQITFGSSGGIPGTVNYLYACEWHGANAEISDANLKALEQALGWTISWS